jgi:magnesium-transporting ATPase (P-type)
MQWFFVAQILYKVTTCLTKMSMAMMYLRIFPNRKFRIAVIAVMGITIVYTIAAVLLTVFACNPIDKSWNKALPGTCVDSRRIWYCKWWTTRKDPRVVTRYSQERC